MVYHPSAPQAGRRASLKRSAFPFLMLLLFFCCPLVHAGAEVSETGPITVRDLKAPESTVSEPALSTQEVGNTTSGNPRMAQSKPQEPAAPAAGITPPSSDEYGDVTAKDVGERAPSSATAGASSDEYGDVATEDGASAEPREVIADPIKPFNIAMYHFNDKLYFWAWKPVATGYKYVLPREIRGLFSSFYANLKAPIRIVNNLLQGEPGYAGKELASFLINSTIGVGGLRNCAEECFGLRGRYADFGQTLGKYGVGFGFYLVLPFVGPSSVRDGFGFLVDWTMRPQTYIGDEFFSYESVGLYTHEQINSTSFHLGEYEAFKKASVDPYVSMRDIFIQYRKNLIENR